MMDTWNLMILFVPSSASRTCCCTRASWRRCGPTWASEPVRDGCAPRQRRRQRQRRPKPVPRRRRAVLVPPVRKSEPDTLAMQNPLATFVRPAPVRATPGRRLVRNWLDRKRLIRCSGRDRWPRTKRVRNATCDGRETSLPPFRRRRAARRNWWAWICRSRAWRACCPPENTKQIKKN